MIERRVFLIALIFCLFSGCAHRIDVQYYTFGSPMHHTENGIEFIDLGFTEDAVREFRTALADNPRFSPALAGKGIYWAVLGVPDVAVGYIELAERYAIQDNEQVFCILASMRVSLIIGDEGWFERVSDDYDRIMAISPDNDRALYWMGIALMKEGDIEGAKKKFKKVVELEGKYKRQAQRFLKEGQ